MAYSADERQATKLAAEVKAMAILKIRTYGLELTVENVAHWFEFNEYPSPTMFALDFGFEPSELGINAQANPLVRRSLYRIIAMAEEQLYIRVFGPKAVIQRVETLISGVSGISDDEVNGEDQPQGLFVSA